MAVETVTYDRFIVREANCSYVPIQSDNQEEARARHAVSDCQNKHIAIKF
jgi:hypothetical protein